MQQPAVLIVESAAPIIIDFNFIVFALALEVATACLSASIFNVAEFCDSGVEPLLLIQ